MTDHDFGAGASVPIQLRITQALRVRTRIPMAAEADAAKPLLPAATWQADLECVGLDGFYRVLLIAVRDDEVRMLTNFILAAGETPYLDWPSPALVPFSDTSQGLANTIASRLSQLQFANGAGGPEKAADGSVHFLTIRSTTETQRTALYFYHYPATTRRFTRPDGLDGPRWDAVNGVYELWRDIMSNQTSGKP